MIDAVLTSHPDALTCGTAKFSRELAQRLGVPCRNTSAQHHCRHPLVSIRLTEEGSLFYRPRGTYDVLLHDVDERVTKADWWLKEAGDVYAANQDIADALRVVRPDVQELWCPSTLQGNATRGTLDILTFGMAHRMGAQPFEQLKALLDNGPQDYTISLSTAIHDGKPWDEGFQASHAAMSSVFGSHLRALGFLADDGLARIARAVNAIALFYQGGVRQNNTSFWAALETGQPVITNLDTLSPPELIHNVSIFDIAQMTAWPDAEERKVVRAGAQSVLKRYSWDRLVATLKAPVHA